MENKDNSGALFKSEKTSDKHPDYKGSCMVNGQLMYIAAWVNTAESGKKYMSLSFTAPSTDMSYNKEDSTATSPPEFSKPQASAKSDDDLPF